MEQVQVNVGASTDDKKEGLTLGELASFVQSAMRADMKPTTRIRVNVGVRSQIIRIYTENKP